MNSIASIATVATGAVRLARGDDAGGDVHLAEHPAAEDMAVGVDVAGPRHDPQDRLAASVVSRRRLLVAAAAGLVVMAGAVGEEDQAHQPGADQHGEADAGDGRDHMWIGTGSPKLFR